MREGKFLSWDITYLTGGSARYTFDGVDYELGEGDLICLPPGHVRAATTTPDNLMVCFSVDFRLKNLSDGVTQLPFPLVSHIGLHKELVHLFQELAYTWIDRQPGYIIKTQALFLLIVYQLYEILVYDNKAETTDYRIKKVTRYIMSHYTEKVSVSKMAAMTGLSIGYFGTLFKQETGMTMNQYLVRTRLKIAEEMLNSGKYKVNEVADCCGYSDLVYFYKQFKQAYRVSPSQCIPKMREY
jgi:AraC-like DNA-binding protein